VHLILLTVSKESDERKKRMKVRERTTEQGYGGRGDQDLVVKLALFESGTCLPFVLEIENGGLYTCRLLDRD
jgi:hypothetical protein